MHAAAFEAEVSRTDTAFSKAAICTPTALITELASQDIAEALSTGEIT